MNTNRINPTLEDSRSRWPFPRRSAAWLLTLTTNLPAVAQVGNLLYHRLEVGWAQKCRPVADCQSATQQTASLRYGPRALGSKVAATFALCLLGGLLIAQAQDPRLTNTNNPVDTNVSVGATVNFRLFASSTNLPLTYQWYHAGAILPAATNITLLLTNVTVAQAGGYVAWVTNASGDFTNTRTAMVTVDPTFTQITTGPLVTDTLGGWNASWIDYDGDGKLDVSIAPKAGALRTTPIYHNEGDGTFRRITTNVIAQTQVNAWTHVWADYDNDGRPDLFVPNTQGMNDMLFHNEGNGVFTRITTGHPVIDASGTSVGAWADVDRDGFLDLFVTTEPCPSLYRNNGDRTFRKMTLAEVGPAVECLGEDYALWADVDNDGWPELYRNVVPPNQPAGWSMTNHVYHFDSQGRSTLMDIGELRRGREGYASITWADYDNDGLLDALSGAERGLFDLYRNLGGQGFTNVTASALPRPMTNGYSGLAVDYDNDGWLDILFYNWNWTAFPVTWLRNNGDGKFTQQYVGGPSSLVGGGLFFGDYNNDGFLDIVVLYDAGRRNSLFRHNGNTNHWLKVKLDGRASNRSGIGAKVRVNATVGGRTFWQMREVSGQGGVCLDNGLIAHFGLGDATNVTTLRIEWPSGIVQEIQNVPANQFLPVVESQSYGSADIRPSFTGATKDAGGLQLSFTEPAANARYLLEASSDLVNWTKLMARTSAGITGQFTDTRATNYTRRFYRLQVP